MVMRRGWAGFLGVIGVSLSFACVDSGPGQEETEDPGGVSAQSTTFEEAVPEFRQIPCTTLEGVAGGRKETVDIPAGRGRAVRLRGNGRSHLLQIWPQRSGNRRLVLTELPGDTVGVNLQVEEGADTTGEPWGVLTLDARGCPANAYIVKRNDDGTLTNPGGGYDSTTASAFVVLRGNSGYLLATPD